MRRVSSHFFLSSRKFSARASATSDTLRSDEFVIDKLREVAYPNEDYHRVFVGEIVGCWEK